MTDLQRVIVLSIAASTLVHRYQGAALWALICDNADMKLYTVKAVGWQAALIESLHAGGVVRTSRHYLQEEWTYRQLSGRGL